MSITRFTDETGKPFRTDCFPLRIDKRYPSSAGFVLDNRKKGVSPVSRQSMFRDSLLKNCSLTRLKTPPTYLMVDYPESRIQSPAFGERRPSPTNNFSADAEVIRPKTASSTLQMRSLKERPKFAPQPLKSSFLLKQKVYIDDDVSGSLYKRKDAIVQTEVDLQRLDLPGVKDYQKWVNDTAEPFIKVTISFCSCFLFISSLSCLSCLFRIFVNH
jgi:hypothetical protein